MTRFKQHISFPMFLLLIALILIYMRGTAYKKALEKNQRAVLAKTQVIKQLEQKIMQKQIKATGGVTVVTKTS